MQSCAESSKTAIAHGLAASGRRAAAIQAVQGRIVLESMFVRMRGFRALIFPAEPGLSEGRDGGTAAAQAVPGRCQR